MIIVSQDRETVVNFENIIRIKVCKYNGENYIQCDFPYGTYEDLGTYKTKERAKEVLQEIKDRYLTYAALSNQSNSKDIKQVSDIPKHYEMPEE